MIVISIDIAIASSSSMVQVVSLIPLTAMKEEPGQEGVQAVHNTLPPINILNEQPVQMQPQYSVAAPVPATTTATATPTAPSPAPSLSQPARAQQSAAVKARNRNPSANGPTVASQADDEKYVAKFRDMKSKTKGLMKENDKLYLRLLKTQWSIKRAKLYRAILYERLSTAKNDLQRGEQPAEER
ncbi:hypothetical protein E3P99_02120 [Wallemia hederae]|uniref:INO80 complex subunit F domain-containing protein n=1 Tax=Wallemia hederae TaxID=1540922 RepID=A0A4T0FNG2_9BASI|nr:hypothetical protein E3P99_02120 [Wallemia hederae]